MSTTPKACRIPNCELESVRVIFWRAETVMIFFAFTVVGGIFDHPGWGAAIGVALGALWERASTCGAGRPIHLVWWYLGVPKLRATPPSAKRFFIG